MNELLINELKIHSYDMSVREKMHLLDVEVKVFGDDLMINTEYEELWCGSWMPGCGYAKLENIRTVILDDGSVHIISDYSEFMVGLSQKDIEFIKTLCTD